MRNFLFAGCIVGLIMSLSFPVWAEDAAAENAEITFDASAASADKTTAETIENAAAAAGESANEAVSNVPEAVSKSTPEAAESTVAVEQVQPAVEAQPEGENPVVIIKTGKGDIKVKLFKDKAPVSVENFLKYVDSGHYEGTIFHRVMSNFMIQGGGFTADMQQKATLAPIKNEAQNGLLNTRGTLAMARTQVIDSATSQFFINVVDNAFLNFRSPDMQGFGYCVFGEVVEGMDVVDAIRSVPTGRSGPHSDVPVEPVEIIQVVRVNTAN